MSTGSKSQTIGYKYLLDAHVVWCHGVVDKLMRHQWDKRTAWEGEVTGPGDFVIDAPSLFGDTQREGGVGGTCELLPGDLEQEVNAYLASILDAPVPAFRLVTSEVFKQFYWGMNPYLKNFNGRFQRIFKNSDGTPMWYAEKAGIPIAGGGTIPGGEPFAVSLPVGTTWAWMTTAGPFDMSMVANGVDYSGWPLSAGDWDSNGLQEVDIPQGSQRQLILRKQLPPGTNHLTVDCSFMDDWLFAYINGVEVDTDVFWPGSLVEDDPGFVNFNPTEPNELVIRVHDSGAGRHALHNLSVTYSGQTPPTVYGLLDMNPAHMVREALTNPDYGMGYAEADMNDDTFTAAADRLFDEGLGLSTVWDKQMPIEDYVKEICRHANATLYADRKTGKFNFDLIRDDYDVETLIVLGPDDIESVSDFGFQQDELVNSVTVQWWDLETNDTGNSTREDPALVLMQGAVINTTIQYQMVSHRLNGERLRDRDLRTLSTPLRRGTLICKPDNTKALTLNPGKPFILDWPDLLDQPIVVRVAGMTLGDIKNNQVRLMITQSVFELDDWDVAEDPGVIWENPNPPAVPATDRIIVEAPYYELIQRSSQTEVDSQLDDVEEASWLLASAMRPIPSLVNMRGATDAGAGYQDFGVVDFCPGADLDGAMTKLTTTVAITNGKDLDQVVVGTHCQVGTELMKVTAISSSSLSVERGILDTVPGVHADGDKVFFWDAFASRDDTMYASGEELDVKLRPRSGSDTLPLSSAPVDTITMAGRAIRPYPPGNVKIDATDWPTVVAGTFDVTWAHRDRKTQGDSIVSTGASSIGPESTVRYALRFEDASTDALIVVRTDLAGPSATVNLGASAPANVRMELWAISDNGASWQSHVHEFAYSGGTSGAIINGADYVPGSGGIIIDGNDPPPSDPDTGPEPPSGGAGTPGSPTARSIGADSEDACAYGAHPTASAATNMTAINNAFAALAVGGGEVYFSIAGEYDANTANPIEPIDNSRLDASNITLRAVNPSFTTSPSVHRDVIRIDGVSEVEVIVGQLYGYLLDGYSKPSGSTDEWGHGIYVTGGASAITIKDSTIRECVGDAISIGRSVSDCVISNLKASNCRRQGVSCGGDYCIVEDSDIGYIGTTLGTSPMAAIDNEVDEPAIYDSTNMIVRRSRLHHCRGPGFLAYKNCNNWILEDVDSEYNSKGLYTVDSDNGIVRVASRPLSRFRWNRYEGMHLTGSTSNVDLNDLLLYGNKTNQYGAPADGGATTETPSTTERARQQTISSSVTGTTYDDVFYMEL